MVLTVVALVAAGCDRLTAPAAREGEATTAQPQAGNFRHSQSEDLSGYYSAGEAQVGPDGFQLMSLFVGQTADFVNWEQGKRPAGYAPVMLEFLVPGETTERVLPDSYAVSDGRIRMSGTSADGVRISVDGQMNTGALATARRNLGGGEAAAVTAVVRIGDQSYSGVKLNWTGGD
jgi:hypothetical protein